MAKPTKTLQKPEIRIQNNLIDYVAGSLSIPATVASDIKVGLAVSGGNLIKITSQDFSVQSPTVTFDVYFTAFNLDELNNLVADTTNNGTYSATIIFNEAKCFVVYTIDNAYISQSDKWKTGTDGAATFELAGDIKLVVNNFPT